MQQLQSGDTGGLLSTFGKIAIGMMHEGKEESSEGDSSSYSKPSQVLHCTAPHCTSLHCTALHCSDCTEVYCTVHYCFVFAQLLVILLPANGNGAKPQPLRGGNVVSMHSRCGLSA